MPLVSRWASDEALVAKAKSQDEKAKTGQWPKRPVSERQPVSADPPQPTLTTDHNELKHHSKPRNLDSDLANHEPSAKHNGRRSRHSQKHSAKEANYNHDHSKSPEAPGGITKIVYGSGSPVKKAAAPLNSCWATDTALPTPPTSAGDAKGNKQMSALAMEFARRLGKPEESETHSDLASLRSDHSHKGDHSHKADKNRAEPKSDKAHRAEHKGEKERRHQGRRKSHDLEKAPMSAAGNVLAQRLGMAPAGHVTPKDMSWSERVKEKSAKKDPAPRGGREPRKETAAPARENRETPRAPTGKYMTPKQKAALAAAEEQAKANELLRKKEEQLKAEVKMMFDKMSDSSTNWADLED